MANGFTVSLSAENIGPHFGQNKLSFTEPVKSNKTIIYSANGTGKSFISRAFRLCTPSMADKTADDVLSIGQDEGIFQFGIKKDTDDTKIHLLIKRGHNPTVTNTTGLLFHVFNSDYVDENIRRKNYSPDGNITGYILGKAQIDLSDDKDKEKALDAEVNTDSKAIDASIETAKIFLRQNGVAANTIEYQAITRAKVEQGFGYEPSGFVEEHIGNLNKLATVPDNLADIVFPLPQQDLSFFDTLKSKLTQIYTESTWDEEFVSYYRDHIDFIQSGLNIPHAEKICPFCKREYDADALSLIQQYNQYRHDQEAQIINQLKKLMTSVTQLVNAIDRENTIIITAEAQLLKFQQYFPSLSASAIEKLKKINEYKQEFQTLTDAITAKTENLCLPIDNAEGIIEACVSVWKEIIEIQTRNHNTAESANRTKNSANTERLQLRRQLCKAKSLALQDELYPKIKALNDKKDELKKLHDAIIEKEEQAKVSKRHKVYETLKLCLDRFFSGKYDINEDTFQIRFLGTSIGDKVSSILSDGEKSIVAFCWYLAETHTIVNNEDDYNNLFFVIDDPISSMDFHYVYAVAQTIRELKSVFGFSGHERILVLTHNTDFFNIIIQNNILVNAFLMKPGSIKRFDKNLIMPYESHLVDLLAIADNKQPPNHTTGNSIRHVLETICRFESPNTKLDVFVRENEILSKDAYIYSLCQDLSHGYWRLEPCNEDVLREAAKTVISYINDNYPGQITGKKI